jgi:hypothetical protein
LFYSEFYSEFYLEFYSEFYSEFDHVEIFLADAAFWAHPVVGNIIPTRPWGDAVIG